MSLINKEVSNFKVYAFHENDFKSVTKDLSDTGHAIAVDLKSLERLLVFAPRPWRLHRGFPFLLLPAPHGRVQLVAHLVQSLASALSAGDDLFGCEA